MSFKVHWRGREIKNQADRVSKAVSAKIAFDIEGRTKQKITANNQVDTGFMRNSVYTVTIDGETGGAKSGKYRSKKSGRFVKRQMVTMHSPGRFDAVVGVGAIYAIWVERRNAFFRPSIDDVRGSVGHIGRVEWRRHVR